MIGLDPGVATREENPAPIGMGFSDLDCFGLYIA